MDALAQQHQPPHGGYPTYPEPQRCPPPTDVCRCYGCGSDEPMACGALCADCSWEEHLAAMAHTGQPSDEPHEDTPRCCAHSRRAEAAYWSERFGDTA
jgi:hypothetical protein